MKVDEIKDLVLRHVGEQVPGLVKEAVTCAVKEALQDAGDGSGRGKTEKQIADEKAAQDAATKGKSVLSTKKREREKGEAIGPFIRAAYYSKNDPDAVTRLLKRDGHEDLAEIYADELQSFVSGKGAMSFGDPETGGILIPQPVAAEIIDLLRAQVLVRSMNPVVIPMPNGNLRLPKKTQGTTSYYVGESTAPAVSGVKHGSVLLSYKKQITVVPSSNDLFRYSSPGADQLIRNDIVAETAVRQDQAFLRDAGSNATPKGIRFWTKDVNVINATGGVGGDSNLTAVTDTLGRLVLKLLENNIPMANVWWLMSPRTYMDLMTIRVSNGPYAFRDEMLRGTLWGYRYKFSTSVPNNLTDGGNSDTSELYLLDANEVVIGDSQGMIINSSDVAAYQDGGTVKAAFTNDETVIRAISEHDLALRRDEAIAVAKQLRWGV